MTMLALMKIFRRVLVTVLGLFLVWLLACFIVLLHPPHQDENTPSDVRLYLASDGGYRAFEAPGRAEKPGVQLLSRPDGVRNAPVYDVCGKDVECIVPDPVTTQGEAEAFARLAAQRGWTSVTVYTHTTHAERAAFRIHQCFPGVVRVAAVDTQPSPLTLFNEFWHETAAWIKVLFTLKCGDRAPGGD